MIKQKKPHRFGIFLKGLRLGFHPLTERDYMRVSKEDEEGNRFNVHIVSEQDIATMYGRGREENTVQWWVNNPECPNGSQMVKRAVLVALPQVPRGSYVFDSEGRLIR